MAKVVVVRKTESLPAPRFVGSFKPKGQSIQLTRKPVLIENVEEDEWEEFETDSEEEFEPLPEIKSHECNKEECEKCLKECFACPYLPLCCNLPLTTALQFIIMIDMLVVIVTLAMWGYLHHFDPFQAPTGYISRNPESSKMTPAPSEATAAPAQDAKARQSGSGTIENDAQRIDKSREADPYRFSKIAYLNLEYRQEIEQGCGHTYYDDHLFGDRLNETRGVFLRGIQMIYVSEFMELFVDITFLITTCCFFSFTSARFYLIAIWHSELMPMGLKLWISVATQSKSLCIFQHGVGRIGLLPGLSLVRWVHIVPLILYRLYKFLIFSYFIRYLFTFAGHLSHNTRVQGVSLKEYKQRQKKYLQMISNRDYTSSDDDEI